MFEIPEFKAPWWLPSPHPQTIGGRFLRRPRSIVLKRERWETPDGDFVDLDFGPPISRSAPLVLLLHGLEGSAQRKYAINTYQELADRGIASVGLNFRSCSGELNRLARSYHSGDTEDIRFVLRALRTRFADVPIGTIGFSLGGNALLKFLGEEAENARDLVSAAVAVSVPFDLSAGADFLNSTRMGRFYTSVFIKPMRAKVEQKLGLIGDSCDLARARAAKSFREWDDAVTAPLHGFNGVQDYYDRSSSKNFIPHIRVPTLLLHAEDDPFLPSECIPRSAIVRNPNVSASIEKTGGHVGFIHGTPLKPQFWAEQNAARFLAERLIGAH